MRRGALKLWGGRFLLAILGPLFWLEVALQVGAQLMPGAPSDGKPMDATPCCVLCVGDSFTFGLGASSPATSYPARLEERLRAAPIDGRWRIANGGVPARNSRDVLLDLPRQFARQRPRFVVVLVGANELWSRPPHADIDAAARDAGIDGPHGRWTWRTWKLVQLLLDDSTKASVLAERARADGAESTKTAAAVAPRRPPPKPTKTAGVKCSWELAGSWNGGGRSIRFDRDGRGTLDGAAFRWRVVRTGELEVAVGDEAQPVRVRATRRAERLVIAAPDATSTFALERAPDPEPPPGVPRRWDWYPELARLEAAGDHAGAFERAERWIAATPDDPDAWWNHVAAANHVQRYDVFANDLAQLERIFAATGTCDAAEDLVNARDAANQFARAAELAKEQIARFPESASLHTIAARAAEGAGDFATAVLEMTRSIDEDVWSRGHGLAYKYRERARWNDALRREDEAIRDLVYAIREQVDESLDVQLLMRGNFDEGAADAGGDLAEASADERSAVRARFAALRAMQSPSPKTYVDHLTQIVRWVREQGAEPLLCTYPFAGFAFESRLREVAAREHVRLVDLVARFQELLRTLPRSDLFVADGHCNDRGYAEMAAEIEAALRGFAH